MFFAQRTDLFDGSHKKMLHVAPEEFLSALFSRIVNLDYLSADLCNPRAMVRMDITDIDFPDDYFSVIYCSHVLEHITDDRKALAEFYRVLRPNGWAVLQVPIASKQTCEDTTIIAPAERKKHFGHWDHVRRCGPDYVERMRATGFDARIVRATDVVSKEECMKMGFRASRIIFHCKKPQ